VRNEFAEAESLMRRAHQRRPGEATATALALILRGQNSEEKANEAMALYERSLSEHLDYGENMLSDYEPFALERGRVDQVLSLHRDRLRRDPDNLPSLRSLSILLMQMGQLHEGLALNARWIQQQPESSEAHRMRGLALADLGQMEQAIVQMQHAVELAPRDQHARGLLADMLDAVGRSAEAGALRKRLAEEAAEHQGR
jgi:tetratricopeptide (TPR) repeat protein